MKLIDPQIRQGYGQIMTRNAFPTKRKTFFDYYAGEDCGLGKAGDHIVHVPVSVGMGQTTVHRAAFLDQLVALVPKENVTFGKKVLSVEELDSGVRIHFQDGKTAEASAAVGCDGVRSKLRLMVLGDDDEAAYPAFTGKYAYRSLIPMDKAVGLLGDELARNNVMWCGQHRHVLTFPIEKGECMNVIAFGSKRDWEDERWVLSVDKKIMEDQYTDWGDSVKKILSLMEKPDMWALFDYPPAKTFFKGRTCLSGDAAHASTPHQGAGAGMALEDAYILSSVLGAVDDELGIEHAFRAFDHVRRPRAQKLVKTSRECGVVVDCEDEEVGDDVEKFRENMLTRYHWIWEKRLEDDLEEAMGVLEGWKEANGRL